MKGHLVIFLIGCLLIGYLFIFSFLFTTPALHLACERFERKNVAPGDKDSVVFVLKNAGKVSGKVSMKIVSLSQDPGTSPEPEPLPDNGELAKNLYFKIIINNVSAQAGYLSELAGKEMEFGELKAGEVLLVKIEWSIPNEVGNEIQGDKISFDIEFKLSKG